MMALPFFLRLYQRLTPLLKPFVLAYIRHRIKKGKEDPKRLTERFGKASVNRPNGSIIWLHGASVGEAVSLLPLVQRLRIEFPQVSPLITTGTVTAASVISKALPEGCIHQFIPIDLPEWIHGFLDHWQPDVGVFVESELWPNIILACRERKIPLYLINATMSEKSYQSWQRLPSVISYLLSSFDRVLAQSQGVAERLIGLGAEPKRLQVCGNLKFAASPLPYDPNELERLKTSMKGRTLWVAASTHEGEESLVAEAHQIVKQAIPNLLTLIIPRHPSRGDDISQKIQNKGLIVARRSKNDSIQSNTNVYLVDTMGELGLFYRLSGVAFIGGTFVPIGGHNPIEAVLLDCAVTWGPHIYKQVEICEVLGPAAFPVATVEELASAVQQLLENTKLREEHVALGHKLVSTQIHILDHIIHVIGERLPFKKDKCLA